MTELPKIVGQRLQAGSPPAAHPDPDLLNAFVEQSLGRHERAQIVEHLSQCSDCREVLAFSFPEPATPGVVGAKPNRVPWLSWPVLRWSALATAVVVIGAAVGLHYQPGRSLGGGGSTPRTDAPLVAEKAAAPAVLPAPSNELATSRQSSQAAEVKRDLASAGAAKKPAEPSRHEGVKVVGGPSEAGRSLAPAANLAQPALEANAETKEANVTTVNSVQNSAMDELVPGRAKDAGQELRGPPANMQLATGMLAKQKAGAAAAAGNLPTTPATAYVARWTLTSDGTLERSLDSGKTWKTIPVNNQTSFRALAANGMDIWVGGSRGALYHSTDAGQDWTQVHPVAEGEALTADIIGVQFSDPEHGTLTTSTEETWVTSDAGQTWQKK